MVAVHSEPAPPGRAGCVSLAEYRLDELARISGVSARNIRAYRERGLLDPPRRVGRSAFYDDYHLSQLRTINQLLRRGFNSAHIAEFFASMRQGADLADILGIQRAVLGPRTEETPETADASQLAEAPPTAPPSAVDIDPDSEDARKLIEYGLAEIKDGGVVMVDPAIGEIVARSTDRELYVRALLHIYEATRGAVDSLAGGFVDALEESVEARFGKDYAPKPDEVDELSQIVADHRDLWSCVVSDRLDKSVQEQMASALSSFTADVLLSGDWQPKAK
jgi:DNA-binding transcriptional MerR regulator